MEGGIVGLESTVLPQRAEGIGERRHCCGRLG